MDRGPGAGGQWSGVLPGGGLQSPGEAQGGRERPGGGGERPGVTRIASPAGSRPAVAGRGPGRPGEARGRRWEAGSDQDSLSCREQPCSRRERPREAGRAAAGRGWFGCRPAVVACLLIRINVKSGSVPQLGHPHGDTMHSWV